ncbi:MAG: hypothetical protein RIJ37_16910 [Marinovum algicola]
MGFFTLRLGQRVAQFEQREVGVLGDQLLEERPVRGQFACAVGSACPLVLI